MLFSRLCIVIGLLVRQRRIPPLLLLLVVRQYRAAVVQKTKLTGDVVTESLPRFMRFFNGNGRYYYSIIIFLPNGPYEISIC